MKKIKLLLKSHLNKVYSNCEKPFNKIIPQSLSFDDNLYKLSQVVKFLNSSSISQSNVNTSNLYLLYILKEVKNIIKSPSNVEPQAQYQSPLNNKFSLTLIKHHWWSKLNTIFRQCQLVSYHNSSKVHKESKHLRLCDFPGPVLFLEDDYFLSPDALTLMLNFYNYTYANDKYNVAADLENPSVIPRILYKWPLLAPANLKIAKQDISLASYIRMHSEESSYFSLINKPSIPLISIGSYDDKSLAFMSAKALALTQPYRNFIAVAAARSKLGIRSHQEINIRRMDWWPSQHNMGMILDRVLFDALFGSNDSVESFCSYDDYNWDWTLGHLFNNVLRKQNRYPYPLRIEALYPQLSRIYHLGLCGVHQKINLPAEDDEQEGQDGGGGFLKESDGGVTTKIDSVCSVEASVRLLESNFKILGFTAAADLPNEKVQPFNFVILSKEMLPWIMGSPNGGWSKESNYQLCLNETYSHHHLR